MFRVQSSGFAVLVALSVLAVMWPLSARQAQDPGWIQELGGVEASGMKRSSQAQVVALAGLRVGQMIGPQDVEAGRQRLLKSGLFASVGYSYRTRGYLLIVTYTVQEVAWQTPVVFDNFVDQTDAQLIAAVARDVPTFDGLAPDQSVVLAKVAAALERVARDTRDPGTVSYSLVYDKAKAGNHWRFHLDRASGPLPICAVNVPGLPGAIEGPVRDRTASLVGADYSRDLLLNFAQETVAPMIASQGSAARVSRVDVRREPARPGCERGVTVTIVLGVGSPVLFRSAVQH